MVDSIKDEIEHIVQRRKWETHQACLEMERRNMFNNKKNLKVIMPCEVCSNFNEFFIAEARKVCDSCLRESRTKEDVIEDRIMAEFRAYRETKRRLK